MANVESNFTKDSQALLEVASTDPDTLYISAPHLHSIDRPCDQGQCIDANLSVSSEPGKNTEARRSRKSSVSQEFDFNMHLGFASDSLESAQAALAPADELFYQGQLLPLERESAMYPLISNQEQLDSDVTVSCPGFASRTQSAKCSSCRMDAIAIGPRVVEFRCSASFCSQSSGRWESTAREKGTEESTCSQDSSGSSQDSFFSVDMDLRGHCAQGRRSSSGDCRPGPAGPGALNLKSFFGGLKTVFKVMRDIPSNEVLHSGDQTRKGPSRSSSNRCAENLCGNETTTGLYKRINSSKLKDWSALLAKRDVKEIRERKVDVRSAFWRDKPKAGMHGSTWRRYARKLRPLYTKVLHSLSAHHELRMNDGETTCAMASSTRSLWPGDHHKSLDCSSSRFFIASCPASVRSSPTNSGVLAIITKNPAPDKSPQTVDTVTNMSMSTMQELNSAIQSAIAHCKESISGTPVLVSPSAAVL